MSKVRQMDGRPPVTNSQGLTESVDMTSQGIEGNNGVVSVVILEGIYVGRVPLGNAGHCGRLLRVDG